MIKRNVFAIATMLTASAALAQIGAGEADYPSYKPGPDVKNGYSADDLLDAEVRGANNDQIGEVEDLIIGPDGELRRLVVSVNEGWFGTGGRRLAVGFKHVQAGPKGPEDIEYLTVPITKRNVEEYGLFKDKPKSVKGGEREWRATELLGDYVNLKDFENYGSVTDLMFDRQGQLRAIAASPDRSGSILSFYTQYQHDGWEPGDEYYVIPYTSKEIHDLVPEKQQRKSQVQ